MGCWARRDIGLHAHEEIQMTFNLGAGRLRYKIDDALVVVARSGCDHPRLGKTFALRSDSSKPG
jgi:hypothetical protein